MKTKLLKKVRKLHPIYYNRTTKKYKYQTLSGRECLGGIYQFDYKSEWDDNYTPFLQVRRKLIIRDATTIFNKSLFTYKRKRKKNIEVFI